MPIIPDITWLPDSLGPSQSGPGSPASGGGSFSALALDCQVSPAGAGVLEIQIEPAGGSQTLDVAAGSDHNLFTLAGSPATAYHWTININGDQVELSFGSGWPAGSIFTLNNYANIYGRGGAGGGDAAVSDPGADGSNGTDALSLNGLAVSINNGGNIYGGGGGGAQGGNGTLLGNTAGSSVLAQAAGGGGGAGESGDTASGGASTATGMMAPAVAVYALAGATTAVVDANGTSSDVDVSLTAVYQSNPGNDGDDSAAGTGVDGSQVTGTSTITAGAGGDGGDWGEDGSDGAACVNAVGNITAVLVNSATAGGSGGTAGKAVALGGGSVVWLAGYNASQVKGSVA